MTIKNRKPKLIFLVTTIIAIILIITVLDETDSNTFEQEELSNTVPISVHEVIPDSYRSTITLMGEVVPEWQTVIRSQVNGQITEISNNFKEGRIVEKDEILMHVEDQEYRSSVAEAEVRLLNAKVNLKNEQSLLRKSYIEAAKKEVEAAAIHLEVMENELQKTVIKSPYRGLIVERNINKGEIILAGHDIAMLYSIEKSTISTSLNASQWDFLPTDFEDIEATLIDPENRHSWGALVSGDSHRLRRESRLRSLFLEVESPLELNPPLLNGTFLNVVLKGRYLDNLLKIDESALTKTGYIWFVKNNKLLSLKMDPLYREDNYIYTDTPEAIEAPFFIANAPNTTFIDGMNVVMTILKGDK